MNYFKWIINYTSSYYFEENDHNLVFYPWGKPGQSFNIDRRIRLKFLCFFVILVFACISFLVWGIIFAKLQIYTIITALNVGILLSIFYPYLFILFYRKKFQKHKIDNIKDVVPRIYEDYKQLLLIQFLLISTFMIFNFTDVIVAANFIIALLFYPILLIWIKKRNGNLINFV